MNSTNPPIVRAGRLALLALILLAPGCSDGEVSRGAGSIDIPETAFKKYSFEKKSSKFKGGNPTAPLPRSTQ